MIKKPAPEANLAFIDAQNLYLGTTQAEIPWTLDLHRFRKHLEQKYKVKEAYYFLGARDKRRLLEYKK